MDDREWLSHVNSFPTRHAACVALGITERALRRRINRVKARVDYVPPAAPPIHKPRLSVPAATQSAEGQIYTVVAIGDSHDKPGRDKERFKWLGRFCAEIEPDFIVHIGDFASLDSLSSHEAPGSQADAERPAFHDELESLSESLSLFHRDLQVGEFPVFITLGNHEHRVRRVANLVPKHNGDLPARIEQVFSQFRWIVRPYGEFLTIAEVDFVHIPQTVMGRDFGGEHVERTIASKAVRSIVHGHTHRFNVFRCPKVGQQRAITVVNLGTSMPMGLVEPYTGVAMSGWSYGAVVLRICNGDILSVKHYDMTELEARFKD